jgi:anti-anti-sigma factor
MISIEIAASGDRPLVKLAGRLDVQTAQEFQDAVLPLAQSSAAAPVLDITGVNYLSSMGLRALAVVAKAAGQKGGTLRVIGAQPEVLSILRRCGFETFMDIERHGQ